MKKYIAMLLIACILLSGCGAKKEAEPEENAPSLELTAAEALLVGEWIAAGIVMDGTLYSLSIDEALADLYDTNWIYIHEDKSFLLQNGVFSYQGNWFEAPSEGENTIFVLNQTESIRYVMEDEELKPVTTASENRYYAAHLDSGCNVLLVSEGADDDMPLVYVRDGEESYLTAMTTGAYSEFETEQKPSSSKDNTSSWEPVDSATTGQRNALKTALDYLEYIPFSYSGLIEQLEYEGYTHSEAVYAVDNCGADWYEQAVKSAQRYLEYMSFSRSGLIEQLEYEGFTHEQAVYGVDRVY